MPAPTNISFVTAIELGPLPNSITQNVNDSGTTYTVYYKYTTAVDGVFEFFAFGDLIAYTVSLFIYEDSDLVNPYLGFGFDDVRNAAVVVPMSAGHVYYFKCVSYGGNVSPAVLIIDGDDTPDGDLSSGNLFIQDDADGYPGTATYLTTGSVIKYINPFPAGEIGTAIPGFVAVIDDTDDLVKIYSVDTTGFTFVTSVNPFPGEDLATQGKGAIGSNHTDKFYVGCANVGGGAGHTQVKSISTAGVVLQTWTLPGTLLYVMDVAQDSGILYYSENAIATAIKRYDLVNDIALANLYAGLALHTTSDIKTLSDGTILVCFVRAGNTEVIHFSAAGATLNTYPFGNANSGFEARMDVYIDDPISFIIWIHALPNNRFDHIQISDGTTISSI